MYVRNYDTRLTTNLINYIIKLSIKCDLSKNTYQIYLVSLGLAYKKVANSSQNLYSLAVRKKLI